MFWLRKIKIMRSWAVSLYLFMSYTISKTPFVFQDVIKETFESSVEDGILTLKADVEGKDEVAKKTVEIKFENKK